MLQYADATIATGNTTTVLGALVAGVPMLLLPGGGEQPDLAETCVKARVALALDARSLSPRDLSRALDTLMTDQSLRRQAREVSALFGRESGRERAADLIVRLARERRPIVRSA